jgi:hypothetical protein
MAQEVLNLTSRATDKGTVSLLKNIRKELEGISRSPAGREATHVFRQLGEQVGSLGGDVMGTGAAMRVFSAGGFGMTSAVGAIAAAVIASAKALKDYSSGVVDVKNLTREVGLSAREVQRFQFVMEQSNITNEASSAGLRTFADRLHQVKLRSQEARQFFERHHLQGLGAQLRGDADDPAKALQHSLEALGRLKNPQDRGLLAEFLFGSKDFARLDANEIARLSHEFEKLKPTQGDIQAAAAYQLEWSKLAHELERLKNLSANDILPGMTQLLKDLSADKGSEEGFFGPLIKALKQDADDLAKVYDFLKGIRAGAPTSMEELQKGLKDKPGGSEYKQQLDRDRERDRDQQKSVEEGTKQGSIKAAPEVGKEIGKSLADMYQRMSLTPEGAPGGGVTKFGGGKFSIYGPSSTGNAIRASLTPGGGAGGGVPSGGAGERGTDVPTGVGGPGGIPKGKAATARTMAETMRAAGASNSTIAGIMANVQDESGFNPTLRHPDQPRYSGEAHYAHGLYQEGGAEWNKYDGWLKQNYPGADWRDPKLQTQFLAENLKKNYPKVWGAMQNGTKEQAAQAFVSGYLKPAKRFEMSRRAKYGRGVPGVDNYTGPMGATAPTQAPVPSDIQRRLAEQWGVPMGKDAVGGALGNDKIVDALRNSTGATKVEGSASIKVDVNAPAGTNVSTSAEGLFNSVVVNRGKQMPRPEGGYPE